MANTVIWNKHDYVTALRKRLDRPVNWGAVCKVVYSDIRTIVNAVVSTEPSVVTGTRGTAYNYEDFALTADTLTIDTTKITPIFIDEADRSQQSYFGSPQIADFQGKKVNEKIESALLANHTNWTNFGVGDLAGTSAGDTAQITVSSTNIDDLVRAIKRTVYVANGVELAIENGFFSIWRPADFELLEGFVQSSGFTEADVALKNGVPPGLGFKYLGMEHYLSNDHAANHLFAGVKKMQDLGILRSTYGRAKFIEDPAKLSGLGVVSRVDYGFQTSVPNKTLIFDVNVV